MTMTTLIDSRYLPVINFILLKSKLTNIREAGNKEEMADAQQMCDDLEKQIASLKIAF